MTDRGSGTAETGESSDAAEGRIDMEAVRRMIEGIERSSNEKFRELMKAQKKENKRNRRRQRKAEKKAEERTNANKELELEVRREEIQATKEKDANQLAYQERRDVATDAKDLAKETRDTTKEDRLTAKEDAKEKKEEEKEEKKEKKEERTKKVEKMVERARSRKTSTVERIKNDKSLTDEQRAGLEERVAQAYESIEENIEDSQELRHRLEDGVKTEAEYNEMCTALATQERNVLKGWRKIDRVITEIKNPSALDRYAEEHPVLGTAAKAAGPLALVGGVGGMSFLQGLGGSTLAGFLSYGLMPSLFLSTIGGNLVGRMAGEKFAKLVGAANSESYKKIGGIAGTALSAAALTAIMPGAIAPWLVAGGVMAGVTAWGALKRKWKSWLDSRAEDAEEDIDVPAPPPLKYLEGYGPDAETDEEETDEEETDEEETDDEETIVEEEDTVPEEVDGDTPEMRAAREAFGRIGPRRYAVILATLQLDQVLQGVQMDFHDTGAFPRDTSALDAALQECRQVLDDHSTLPLARELRERHQNFVQLRSDFDEDLANGEISEIQYGDQVIHSLSALMGHNNDLMSPMRSSIENFQDTLAACGDGPGQSVRDSILGKLDLAHPELWPDHAALADEFTRAFSDEPDSDDSDDDDDLDSDDDDDDDDLDDVTAESPPSTFEISGDMDTRMREVLKQISPESFTCMRWGNWLVISAAQFNSGVCNESDFEGLNVVLRILNDIAASTGLPAGASALVEAFESALYEYDNGNEEDVSDEDAARILGAECLRIGELLLELEQGRMVELRSKLDEMREEVDEGGQQVIQDLRESLEPGAEWPVNWRELHDRLEAISLCKVKGSDGAVDLSRVEQWGSGEINRAEMDPEFTKFLEGISPADFACFSSARAIVYEANQRDSFNLTRMRASVVEFEDAVSQGLASEIPNCTQYVAGLKDAIQNISAADSDNPQFTVDLMTAAQKFISVESLEKFSGARSNMIMMMSDFKSKNKVSPEGEERIDTLREKFVNANKKLPENWQELHDELLEISRLKNSSAGDAGGSEDEQSEDERSEGNVITDIKNVVEEIDEEGYAAWSSGSINLLENVQQLIGFLNELQGLDLDDVSRVEKDKIGELIAKLERENGQDPPRTKQNLFELLEEAIPSVEDPQASSADDDSKDSGGSGNVELTTVAETAESEATVNINVALGEIDAAEFDNQPWTETPEAVERLIDTLIGLQRLELDYDSKVDETKLNQLVVDLDREFGRDPPASRENLVTVIQEAIPNVVDPQASSADGAAELPPEDHSFDLEESGSLGEEDSDSEFELNIEEDFEDKQRFLRQSVERAPWNLVSEMRLATGKLRLLREANPLADLSEIGAQRFAKIHGSAIGSMFRAITSHLETAADDVLVRGNTASLVSQRIRSLRALEESMEEKNASVTVESLEKGMDDAAETICLITATLIQPVRRDLATLRDDDDGPKTVREGATALHDELLIINTDPESIPWELLQQNAIQVRIDPLTK